MHEDLICFSFIQVELEAHINTSSSFLKRIYLTQGYCIALSNYRYHYCAQVYKQHVVKRLSIFYVYYLILFI